MMTHFSITAITILMACAAAGYALATVGMKMASGGVSTSALVFIALGLGAAALAEIILLRHADLEIIYLGVIVVESILVLMYAAHIGGALSLVQVLGAVFILSGFALVTVGN